MKILYEYYGEPDSKEYKQFKAKYSYQTEKMLSEIQSSDTIKKYDVMLRFAPKYDFSKKDWIGVLAKSMRRNKKDFPIGINFKLLFDAINDGEILETQMIDIIQDTIYHEIGHGIYDILTKKELERFAGKSEEDVVEEFAMMMSGRNNGSDLFDIVSEGYAEVDESKVLSDIFNNFRGMSESEILSFTGGVISEVEDGTPMFLTPSGKIVSVSDSYIGDDCFEASEATHTDLASELCRDIFYTLPISSEYAYGDIIDDYDSAGDKLLPVMLEKGWARLNTGTSDVERRFYCVLPDCRNYKLSARQFDVVEEFVQKGYKDGQKSILIFFVKTSREWYFDDHEPKDIMTLIHRYYNSGNLYGRISKI